MKKSAFLTILFFSLVLGLQAQGYKITVKFQGLANDTIILGHHFAEQQLIPDDTVVTDKTGKGVFEGKEAFPAGMYFLFFSNKGKFDFLLSKNQSFEIMGDTADLGSSIKYKGDPENSAFADYQTYRTKIWKDMQALRVERPKADSIGDKARVAEIDATYTKVNAEAQERLIKLMDENKGTFMEQFLRGAQEVQVPKEITDRTAQYNYYRAHYFDNFDVSNAGLLRTPIYQNKIDVFIDRLIPQHPDSLIQQCDMLIEKSRTNDELFRFMLVHLFNKYAGSQVVTSENVFVHLADKYYLKEASWSDPEYITELSEKIERKKKCLVGNTAQDIQFRLLSTDTLVIDKLKKAQAEMKQKGLDIEKTKAHEGVKYDGKVRILTEFYKITGPQSSLMRTKPRYTILWFWTPDCSHCRKETPLFYEEYVKSGLKEQGVEVLSIFMNKTDLKGEWSKFCEINENWFEFIEEHELTEWQNVWDPFDPYRINYDLNSSPVLYILDDNKKIITKRIGYEQALELIETALKEDK